VIAELIAGAYDVVGVEVAQPTKRHHFKPTYPIGRYLSQPLTVTFHTLEELRAFLGTCRYVSDKEQFGRGDHWQPPESFEQRRRGDCDCFAMWTWRQLLEMGYSARFVTGFVGIRAWNHAWVTFCDDGAHYLVEPLRARAGLRMPRLTTLSHRPWFSVSANGRDIRYFEHRDLSAHFGLKAVLPYLPEWVAYQLRFWPVLAGRWARWALMSIVKRPKTHA
jgi:hypothetical protein